MKKNKKVQNIFVDRNTIIRMDNRVVVYFIKDKDITEAKSDAKKSN